MIQRLHFKCDDIFDHFTKLAETETLPSLDDLVNTAQKLHLTYSSTRGIYHALNDTTRKSKWTDNVPLGKEWIPRVSNPTSLPEGPVEPQDTNGRHQQGDRVLANSIAFMRDASLSEEISFATAEGDAGRVYEAMKVS